MVSIVEKLRSVPARAMGVPVERTGGDRREGARREVRRRGVSLSRIDAAPVARDCGRWRSRRRARSAWSADAPGDAHRWGAGRRGNPVGRSAHSASAFARGGAATVLQVTRAVLEQVKSDKAGDLLSDRRTGRAAHQRSPACCVGGAGRAGARPRRRSRRIEPNTIRWASARFPTTRITACRPCARWRTSRSPACRCGTSPLRQRPGLREEGRGAGERGIEVLSIRRSPTRS